MGTSLPFLIFFWYDQAQPNSTAPDIDEPKSDDELLKDFRLFDLKDLAKQCRIRLVVQLYDSKKTQPLDIDEPKSDDELLKDFRLFDLKDLAKQCRIRLVVQLYDSKKTQPLEESEITMFDLMVDCALGLCLQVAIWYKKQEHGNSSGRLYHAWSVGGSHRPAFWRKASSCTT